MANTMIWFRNDLRLHDNETLLKAIKKGEKVLPVFCFDERWFENTFLQFPKTDTFRANFLIESVKDLKNNLQKIGSNLLVCVGKPENIIPELASMYEIKEVFVSAEITDEEIKIENQIEKKLWKKGIALEKVWQSTLYPLENLPYPIKNLPDIFTQFRKSVEYKIKIKNILPTPQKINTVNSTTWGEIPTLSSLGLSSLQKDERQVLDFKGGESQALARLQTYLWKTEALSHYKETRNNLIGENYSSKFSPWLALGCISPRLIYSEVKKYEYKITKNDSTYWLIFELLWRDYFKFVAKKYGNKIFQLNGIHNKNLQWIENQSLFEAWKNAKTGIPFIDANMRELNYTGFMSNRGRQVVASFLTKDLKINWTWGAMYFESKLIDYDVCSNWGNWIYVAGVGNDPRENRYFNVITQAKKYDPKNEYIKLWIPELANNSETDFYNFDKIENANSYMQYPKPIIKLKE
jgi:deoxyribodipyrimidine photo-lyase